jgi:hypothetical protein
MFWMPPQDWRRPSRSSRLLILFLPHRRCAVGYLITTRTSHLGRMFLAQRQHLAGERARHVGVEAWAIPSAVTATTTRPS